jgi:hypothetical protein
MRRLERAVTTVALVVLARRGFLLISNIMKTKHDTVKNSISNVR